MEVNPQYGRWCFPCAHFQGFQLVRVKMGSLCQFVMPNCLAYLEEILWVGDEDRYFIGVGDGGGVHFASDRDYW